MSEKSEYNRGYKAGKKYFSETFRSFKKTGKNSWIGYTKKGSKLMVDDLSGKKGFHGGWAKAAREVIKARPVKTSKKRQTRQGNSIIRNLEKQFGFR